MFQRSLLASALYAQAACGKPAGQYELRTLYYEDESLDNFKWTSDFTCLLSIRYTEKETGTLF